MRRMATLIGIGLASAVALWIAAGWYTVAGIEQPEYEVLTKRDGYEIRRYAPMLVAETDMATLSNADRGSGFRTLAGYIFGGNTKQDSIAMTAPVVMDAPAKAPDTPGAPNKPGPSEKIAMTAPVVMSAGGPSVGTMRFVLPSKYKTLADLPKPNDPRVRLVEVPARQMAATAFSWFATEARVAEQTAALLAALTRDGVKPAGLPALASYNPPFTPPFMQRHEILIETSGLEPAPPARP